jgi:predicted lipoprotein with Yx(FWY)xxD motif
MKGLEAMRLQRLTGWTGGAMAITLALAGCGGSPSGAYAKTTPSQQTSAAGDYGSPSASPSTKPKAALMKIKVASNGTLGKIVTNAKGWTLYRYDADTAKPSVSHCTGACAKAWPPVKWTAKVKKTTALKGAVFGKIKRADGTWQLTLNGWPLYRYVKDKKPGDTKGQGVGGKWYASTPLGKKAKAITPSTGNSGSGY